MFFDVKLLYWMNEWMNEWIDTLDNLESTAQKLYNTHEGSTKFEF